MSVAQQTAAELVHNIFDLQRALRGITAAGTKYSDLGPAHTGVLFYIGDGAPMRASALATKLGIGPSALSRQLADLEQLGFVVRSPDPLDGRACLLSLSDEGGAYLTETYERRAETLRGILADWTEGEAEAASSTVQHLAAALRAAPSAPGAGYPHPDPRPPRIHQNSTGNYGRHHPDHESRTTKEER